SVEYYSKLERGAIGARPHPSSTRSHAPCNSTTRNGPTCSTSLTPPTEPAPACEPAADPASNGHPDRACNGCSTCSPPQRSSATAGWTCSPATTPAGPCTAHALDLLASWTAV